MLIILIKLLLSWTRPEVAPSPRKHNLPFKTKVYIYILKRLTYAYGSYSSDDTVHIGKGLTIRHSFKDPEFERELQRMNISLKPHLSQARVTKNNTVESNDRSSQNGTLYGYFHFVDILTVTGFGREITIERSTGVDIYGTFATKAMISADNDPISATSVTLVLPLPQKNTDTASKQKPQQAPLHKPAPSPAPKPNSGKTPDTPAARRQIFDPGKENLAGKKEKQCKTSAPGEHGETKPSTPSGAVPKAGGIFARDTIPHPMPVPAPKPAEPFPAAPVSKDVEPVPITEIPRTTVIRGIEIDDDF